jgi:hypothetical protein
MYSYRTNPPNPTVHDRKAKDIARGMAGFVRECEVTDPFDSTAKISVIRSVRSDPLADRHARHHISDCQYEAGRRFQKAFQIAEKGPRTALIAERVDGSPKYESLTDAQLKASQQLSNCYAALGQSGSALAKAMLIDNLTVRQVAASCGLKGQNWECFFAKRFEEVLETLAQVFGLTTAR